MAGASPLSKTPSVNRGCLLVAEEDRLWRAYERTLRDGLVVGVRRKGSSSPTLVSLDFIRAVTSVAEDLSGAINCVSPDGGWRVRRRATDVCSVRSRRVGAVWGASE